jgi:hypothetical protein
LFRVDRYFMVTHDIRVFNQETTAFVVFYPQIYVHETPKCG